MKALILAAGYATRLYPLTKDYPKPLLPVVKRPIINYIIDKLDSIKEIDEIIVITNSKFISKFKKWSKSVVIKKRLSLIDDLTKSLHDRRGAIGDTLFAIKKENIKSDLLVIGGDNLFEDSLVDFLSFVKAHRKSPVIGIYNIKNLQKATHYGVIKLDKKSKVTSFKEKPKKPNSTLVAMCLYYFPHDKLKLINEYIKQADKHDATGSYIDWLRRKIAVYGFLFKGRWYDIGNHKFYRKAKKSFIARGHKISH